ncbi:MAG: hypothetical protein R2774_15205 [Saprospiraceae bacterium]
MILASESGGEQDGEVAVGEGWDVLRGWVKKNIISIGISEHN